MDNTQKNNNYQELINILTEMAKENPKDALFPFLLGIIMHTNCFPEDMYLMLQYCHNICQTRMKIIQSKYN